MASMNEVTVTIADSAEMIALVEKFKALVDALEAMREDGAYVSLDVQQALDALKPAGEEA